MKRLSKYIVIAAVAIGLSSCGVYRTFQTPEVEATNVTSVDHISGIQMLLPDTSLVVVPSWGEYFTDPQLREYIAQALESNSDLQIARLNIDQAQRGLKSARLAYLPTIAFTPEGTISGIAGGTSVKTYTLPITAGWELDLFGRNYNKKHQALSVVEQTREAVRLAQTQLVAAVATNYYALILADEQLRVANKSLAIINETLEVQKSLKEVGMQTQLSVEQTAASLKSFELTIKDLEKSVLLIENNLCLLLNMSPTKLLRAESISYAAPLTEAISLSALSSRPDVRYAEAQLAQSFYGESYARSSLYPSISLGGSVGWTNYYSVILDPAEFVLSALASLTQPIFAANVNRANLANAMDIYEQNLIAFQKSLLSAGKEVNDALIEIENSSAKELLSQEQIARLEAAVSISKDLMTTGKINYLEVLVAQNSYLTAQLDGAAIRYANAVAQINLYKSLGGGAE
ncbi:MAG: efflux transporter outer membrane subunit [Rikenellaceae bacterium]